MNAFLQYVFNPFYERIGLSGNLRLAVDHIIVVAVLVIITFVIGKISAVVFQKFLPRIFIKNTGFWAESLERSDFPRHAAVIISPVAVYFIMPLILADDSWLTVIVRRLALAFIAIISARIIAAFLNVLLLINQNSKDERLKRTPLKSYFQLIKIFLYVISVILAATAIANVSPLWVLSSVGAMSAVLMLVFKDLIIGFVSSMQLSSNDMVRIGDIIDMPKYGADGTVIDITLQSVVVRNYDMSVSAIPIYSFISDSFHNWRGLADAAGRRIKRSLRIDMQSVHFLAPSEIEKLSVIPLLSDYMREKLAETDACNNENGILKDDFTAGRRLTNLGTFRAYAELYLKSLPITAKNMPFVVRQLQPEATGIPLEMYFFCSDKVWVNYERIQADIFDHLLAVIKEFGLSVYQNPSGEDLRLLAERINAGASRIETAV
ncbi:MAG: mechanosensitive ion channel family protein [Spirochaetaceae bacterium]|jgi:miniconductance mechanosensitive channel|nr:mechanosensitive ion channel family protein [Spirochaetaceae bacterium]